MNLALWNKHEKTDPSKTKEAKISGHKITAIDAYSQIKDATEEWGPMGVAWGIKDARWEIQSIPCREGDDTASLGAFFGNLYFPDGSIPISATISIVQIREWQGKKYDAIDDEWTKKAITNALTKGLSYLGFNADVFMGLFDDNKYVKEREMEEQGRKKSHEAPKKKPEGTPATEEERRALLIRRVTAQINRLPSDQQRDYLDVMENATTNSELTDLGKEIKEKADEIDKRKQDDEQLAIY